MSGAKHIQEQLDGMTLRYVRSRFWQKVNPAHGDGMFPDVDQDEQRALLEYELDVIAEVLRHREEAVSA